MGSASTYDGSELAAREKVVVVVLQYRVGILGFLRCKPGLGRGLEWRACLRNPLYISLLAPCLVSLNTMRQQTKISESG